ncbi:tripartite tricarboxylate transporter substrate binding protein [Planococcus salinus]|uniref:Tripartite tricarboxylate transporter substrate binding protein n=2 Tax=Planococcus salinus TaxID=1848460 RepID=A0A3M8P892_9BACL|nr:tripartite tricarboxylate transporter substrate binding protein [Planococcus salinus]
MKMKKKSFKTALMMGALSLSALGLAACGGEEETAEDYPTREIEMVIPWSPGGGSDIEGRIVTEHTQENLDENFVVINLPGVGGTVGLEELAEDEPNGYRLGQIHEGLLVAHHTDITEINYDSFEPIASMSSSDQILAVSSNLGVDTLEEFVEYGQNEEIRFGGTVSGIPRVWVEQLGQELDINYNLVGYEGLSEAIQALAGGHIDAAIVDYSSAGDFVEAGHMKFIAVGTQERVDAMPDVPTFTENGYDISMSINRGYVAPAGTDPAIIETLAAAFEETANDQAYIDAINNVGSSVNFMGPEEYREYLDSQNEIIAEIAAGLEEE